VTRPKARARRLPAQFLELLGEFFLDAITIFFVAGPRSSILTL
jgi:hypothetical protein